MSDTGPLMAGVMPESEVMPEYPGVMHESALRNLCLASPFFRERYIGWEEVGQGAFATVVRTHCVDRGEAVALKVFRHGGDEDDRRRLRAEVQNAQRVVSPLLVRTYSPFDHGGLRWIEMEYVDGTNLDEELRRREAAGSPFSFEEALEIGLCVTAALALAHGERVIHRDLKPANILLPRSRQPLAKLADFGISRFAGADKLTSTGAFPGTPKFGSPEGFRGETLGPAHDVYSLGLSLYLLFTGNRFPFPLPAGYTLQTLVAMHCRRAPLPARSFVPALRARLDALLLRCLEKKPTRRPSAEEVLHELEAVRAGAGSDVRGGPNPRRSRRALLAAAGLAAVAVATLGWSVAGSGRAAVVAPRVEATAPGGPAVPSADMAAPAPQEAGAALSLRINGPFLELRNTGVAIQRAEVELFTAEGRVHKSALPGGLGGDEAAFLPLDGFRPAVRPETRVVEGRVQWLGVEGTLDVRVAVH